MLLRPLGGTLETVRIYVFWLVPEELFEHTVSVRDFGTSMFVSGFIICYGKFTSLLKDIGSWTLGIAFIGIG